MHYLLSFVLFIALTTLTSCGSDSADNSKPAVKKDPKPEGLDMSKVMRQQRVTCASIDRRTGSCPSGMARLFIVKGDSINQCSGFLVSSNILVTNHHCISSARDCDNTYIAVYNGYSYRKTRCEAVIRTFQDASSSTDFNRGQDFAVVELSNVMTATPFKMADPDNLNLKNRDEVTAWVVDHQSITRSRITELECEFVDQSGLDEDDRHKSMILDDCPVISGNSGSPAVDSNNKVVGVIWGGTNDSQDANTSLYLRRRAEAVAVVTDLVYFVDYL